MLKIGVPIKQTVFSYIMTAILIIMAIGATCWLTFNYIQFKRKLEIDLRQSIEIAQHDLAQKLSNQIATMQKTVNLFQTQYVNKSISDNALFAILKQSTFIQAIGIIDQNTEYAIQDNQLKKTDLSEVPRAPSNRFTLPFHSLSLDQSAIGYIEQNVVFIIPLRALKEIVATSNQRIMNYATIVDEHGTLIVQHITQENISNTIFEHLGIDTSNRIHKSILDTLEQKKTTIIVYKDQSIGQQIWIAIEPIAHTHLYLLSAVYPADIFKESIAFERHHIFLISIGVVISLMLIVLLIALFLNTITGWWSAVAVISLICLGQLAFLWYQALTRSQEKHTSYTEVVDHNQLDAFISHLHEQRHVAQLTLIATGIFIEEMVFSHEANGLLPFANISGYIWQRYPKNLSPSIKKDFLLPDAFLLNKNLISQKSDAQFELYCWQFNCKLYETTTLLTYPFDHRHINLRIVHPEILDSIVLVPDFNAYRFLNPYQKPGISPAIDLSNWDIYSSFFCYKKAPYDANLGIAPTAHIANILPQLSFSILCQRTVIGEFMSYLILIMLSIIILFIVLLSFSKHELYTQLLGFNNISIITALSGLLFVLIISQISLRQNLDITGISYIESFYFICYLLIIAIAINSILFAYGKGGRLIQYEHNLIPKLIYWPLFFFLAILATLIAFY